MRTWFVGLAGDCDRDSRWRQSAFAQNAQITGSVKDSSGAIIPGATVTARNVDTGLTRTAVTEATGDYRLPSLPPGRYSVATELSGFSTETRPDIVAHHRPDGDPQLHAQAGGDGRNGDRHRRVADRRRHAIGRVDVGVDAADSGSAGGVAPLDRSRDADARHVAGQHPRPVLSRQRQRRRRRPRVLERLRRRRRQQHVGRDGRAAAELRDGRDSGVQGLDLDLQGGVRARDGRPGRRSSPSRAPTSCTAPACCSSATPRSPRRNSSRRPSRTTAAISTAAPIGGPIVKDKTHFFFAYEGTQENQFLTVNAQRAVAAVRGHVPQRADALDLQPKLDHQLTQGQSLFFRYGAEDEYRPIITAGGTTAATSASFDFAVPRKSAVLGHTWVISSRALNDARFQYAYAKYEVSPAVQPRRLGAGRLHGAAAALHAGFHLSVDHRRRLRQCADGARVAVAVQGRLLVPDAARGAARTSGRWAPTSAASRSRATTPDRRSAAGRSRRTRRTTSTIRRPIRPSTRTRCRPTRTFRPRRSRPTSRTTGRSARGLTFNLGLRYDLQRARSTRTCPALLASIQDKLGRDGSFPLDVSVVTQPTTGRGDFNNFGPRVGMAWDPAEQRRDEHPRRLRDVLRQHADAAELQRADVAAGEADHHHASDVPRSARRAVARLVHHHRAAEHHRRVERHGERRTRTSSTPASAGRSHATSR